MTLNNLNIFPSVILAPMAGVTDTPSREIAQMFNPGLVVSEMIASSDQNIDYFTNTVKSNLSASNVGKKTCPTSIQIAGYDIEWMSFAAKVIEAEGGSIIDINMGCPAKKIIGKLAGSALMKQPDHAIKIIESVVKSTKLPVTLKMRLGWDEQQLNAANLAKRAEDSGVQMITIHARTRNQFYKGVANWELVKEVKDSVSIPIIINGDIINGASAKEAILLSNADGVMIGRGAIGKPWALGEISNTLHNDDGFVVAKELKLGDLVNLHLVKILEFYGCQQSVKIFRKHLASYLKSITTKPEIYSTLMTEDCSDTLAKKIEHAFLDKKINVYQ